MANDLDTSQTLIYGKTATGQQEIQSRALGLPPLTRRLLVLVDGKRSAEELAPFVAGKDVQSLLDDLVGKDCIAVVAVRQPQPPTAAMSGPSSGPSSGPATAAAYVPDPGLALLPPGSQRSAEQVEMARNFMINTINRLLEQNSRLTLTKAIFDSQNADELRTHLEGWETAIGSTWMGRKRLPELRKKLFEVL
jgi:hypothetical protein